MTRYLLWRLGQAVIVLLGVTVVVFVLQNLIASGPTLARILLGPRAGPAQIGTFIREYQLNGSLPRRYLALVSQIVRGNLGFSFKLNQSVDAIVAQDLPKDAFLVGASVVLGLVIAVPLGMLQAAKRNRAPDYVATAVSFALYSMPAYWLGLLLISAFTVSLKLFPAEAPQSASIGGVLSQPRGLVLPIATLTLINFALFSRYMRSSVIEQMAQDYTRTAKAAGASQPRIFIRLILRNALGPVVTLLGLSLPGIITNGLIVEIVFNFPGLGLTFFNAAESLDYPVELGITILVCIATVVGSLMADLAYAALDPRVRLSR